MGKRIDPQVIQEMKTLRDNGVSVVEIAHKYDIKPGTVQKKTSLGRVLKEKKPEPTGSEFFDYDVLGYPFFNEKRAW